MKKYTNFANRSCRRHRYDNETINEGRLYDAITDREIDYWATVETNFDELDAAHGDRFDDYPQ